MNNIRLFLIASIFVTSGIVHASKEVEKCDFSLNIFKKGSEQGTEKIITTTLEKSVEETSKQVVKVLPNTGILTKENVVKSIKCLGKGIFKTYDFVTTYPKTSGCIFMTSVMVGYYLKEKYSFSKEQKRKKELNQKAKITTEKFIQNLQQQNKDFNQATTKINDFNKELEKDKLDVQSKLNEIKKSNDEKLDKTKALLDITVNLLVENNICTKEQYNNATSEKKAEYIKMLNMVF